MNRQGGSGGGSASGLFAITPTGERIDPDADGVLHCTPDDYVVIIGPGGAGGGKP